MKKESLIKNHDLKNSLLLLKNLAELFENGFTPTDNEKIEISNQLKKAYALFKEKIG